MVEIGWKLQSSPASGNTEISVQPQLLMPFVVPVNLNKCLLVADHSGTQDGVAVF